jgi:hypothetical protein
MDAVAEYLAARPRATFAALGLLLAVQIGPWWYSSPDSAQYLSIARTLWSDEGPRSLGSPFLFYPLGYPMLLSPTFLFGERPFMAIGVVQWILAMVMAAGIYRWALRFGRPVAWFAAALTTVHACFGLYYRCPLSEAAFMAALYWGVVVLDRVRTASTGRERLVAAIGGALLILAACQLRPNGIMMAPGFAAALVVHAWRARRVGERRRDGETERQRDGTTEGLKESSLTLTKALGYGLVVGVIASAVFLAARRIDDHRAQTARGTTYWDYLTKIQPTGESPLDRAVEGVRIQCLEVLRLVVPGALKTHVEAEGWGKPNTWVSIVVSMPILLGFILLLRRDGDVMLWTTVFYLGLNVLWAADQGGRYTLPLLPVIAVSLWRIAADGRPRVARWMPAVVALHAAVGVAYWLGIDLPRTREANARWVEIDALAAAVDHDRDRVALFEVPIIDFNLWRSSLDRQVHDWRLDSSAAREEVRWLVTRGSAPPPEFEPVATRGAYQLHRRRGMPGR